MSDTTAVFVGWHRGGRPRERWRAIVEAGTEAEALGKLLDRIKGGDKCVLPRGQDPNTDHPAPRRRRF